MGNDTRVRDGLGGGRIRPEVVDHPRSRMEAELRRGALEASGIEVRIASDDAGGMHPHLAPSTAALRLVVPSAQAEEARAVLAALDAGAWALPDEDDHDEDGSGDHEPDATAN